MENGFENAMEQDAEIVRLRQELMKCSALKSSLYQDLQEGLLTEEQFAQYREIYGRKEQEILSAVSEQEIHIVNDITHSPRLHNMLEYQERNIYEILE